MHQLEQNKGDWQWLLTLEILVEGLPERCIQFKCSCSWTFFSSSTCKEEDADRSSSRRFCSCRQTFCSSSLSKIGRNKTSPARLFKLNKLLSKEQRDLITQYGWGGMLMVKASEMPVDLSMWLMSCYNPIRCELAIRGRGTIPIDANSFHKVLGLPNEGLLVVYEMEIEPISFINRTYNIEGGSAPEWNSWCNMIKDINGVADLKFLRAYFAAVISWFIAPQLNAVSALGVIRVWLTLV